MADRPRLLDLFCGAGGAAMGYHRAGFDVVGVDVVPQPHYPFPFVLADALTYPLDGFEALHASPPCQDHSSLRSVSGERGIWWMLYATLHRFRADRRPWVIENVDRAQFPSDVWRVRLCGSAWGLPLRRHRWFASNVLLLAPPCAHGPQGDRVIGVYGNGGSDRGGPRADGTRPRGSKGSADEARAVMGIDWMNRRELSQAIPPMYTELVGSQLMGALV